MEVFQDITLDDYNAIKTVYPHKFGRQIKDKRRICKQCLVMLKARGYDIDQICNDLFSKTANEYFFALAEFKIQRYFQNSHTDPRSVDFTTGMSISLEKGAVSFDHKGSPSIVRYEYQGEEILKREWEFTYFTVSSIMANLGQPQVIAEQMADDLIWMRKEKFFYMQEDGTYSELFCKEKFKSYVPFVSGMPDLASYYVDRISERVQGRSVLFELVQVELVPFIMAGAGVGLEGARDLGRAFLLPNAMLLDAYIKTNNQAIIDVAINDTTNDFFNYPTSENGVDCRKWFVNRLRQIQDLNTAI